MYRKIYHLTIKEKNVELACESLSKEIFNIEYNGHSYVCKVEIIEIIEKDFSDRCELSVYYYKNDIG